MSYKILIVDDSKLARMAVVKTLNALRPELDTDRGSLRRGGAERRWRPPRLTLRCSTSTCRVGMASSLAAELRRSRPDMPVGVVSANHQQGVIDRALADRCQLPAQAAERRRCWPDSSSWRSSVSGKTPVSTPPTTTSGRVRARCPDRTGQSRHQQGRDESRRYGSRGSDAHRATRRADQPRAGDPDAGRAGIDESSRGSPDVRRGHQRAGAADLS